MIASYGMTGGGESKLKLYPDLFGTGGQRTIYGLNLYTEVEFESARSGLSRLLTLAGRGLLKTHLAKEESWKEAGAMAAALLERKFSGKVVLHVG